MRVRRCGPAPGASRTGRGAGLEGEQVQAGYAVPEEDQAGYFGADAEGAGDGDRAGLAGGLFGSVRQDAGARKKRADRYVAAAFESPLEDGLGRATASRRW